MHQGPCNDSNFGPTPRNPSASTWHLYACKDDAVQIRVTALISMCERSCQAIASALSNFAEGLCRADILFDGVSWTLTQYLDGLSGSTVGRSSKTTYREGMENRTGII